MTKEQLRLVGTTDQGTYNVTVTAKSDGAEFASSKKLTFEGPSFNFKQGNDAPVNLFTKLAGINGEITANLGTVNSSVSTLDGKITTEKGAREQAVIDASGVLAAANTALLANLTTLNGQIGTTNTTLASHKAASDSAIATRGQEIAAASGACQTAVAGERTFFSRSTGVAKALEVKMDVGLLLVDNEVKQSAVQDAKGDRQIALEAQNAALQGLVNEQKTKIDALTARLNSFFGSATSAVEVAGLAALVLSYQKC